MYGGDVGITELLRKVEGIEKADKQVANCKDDYSVVGRWRRAYHDAIDDSIMMNNKCNELKDKVEALKCKVLILEDIVCRHTNCETCKYEDSPMYEFPCANCKYCGFSNHNHLEFDYEKRK